MSNAVAMFDNLLVNTKSTFRILLVSEPRVKRKFQLFVVTEFAVPRFDLVITQVGFLGKYTV